MFDLYERYGHLYDLHTPAQHYQHDHAFVLDEVARLSSPPLAGPFAGSHTAQLPRPLRPPRLLDVGCGTGVLLAKARARGFDAYGIDAAAGMVRVARSKVGREAVTVSRMQELAHEGRWDAITALSWTLHYCTDEAELRDVLARVLRALRPGGLLMAQLAHATAATGEEFEDHETGPEGRPHDVHLAYRFRALLDPPAQIPTLEARYRGQCDSTGERFEETHLLRLASVPRVLALATHVGFERCRALGSWRGGPFEGGLSAWLLAHRPERP